MSDDLERKMDAVFQDAVLHGIGVSHVHLDDFITTDRIEELERELDQAWNAAIHKASAIAKSGVEAYGAKMRAATDKKEKRDWQSMLMAAVDIEHAILTLLKGAKE
jgi:hypothetical protein